MTTRVGYDGVFLNAGRIFKRPGESAYAQARRLLFANPNMTIANLLKALPSRNHDKTVSIGWAANELNQQFTKEQNTTPILKQGEKPEKNCPRCSETGYHTKLFDLPWVTRCPIHDLDLERVCLSCNSSWPSIPAMAHKKCPTCCGRPSLQNLDPKELDGTQKGYEYITRLQDLRNRFEACPEYEDQHGRRSVTFESLMTPAWLLDQHNARALLRTFGAVQTPTKAFHIHLTDTNSVQAENDENLRYKGYFVRTPLSEPDQLIVQDECKRFVDSLSKNKNYDDGLLRHVLNLFQQIAQGVGINCYANSPLRRFGSGALNNVEVPRRVKKLISYTPGEPTVKIPKELQDEWLAFDLRVAVSSIYDLIEKMRSLRRPHLVDEFEELLSPLAQRALVKSPVMIVKSPTDIRVYLPSQLQHHQIHREWQVESV